jgi:hypothetical protein
MTAALTSAYSRAYAELVACTDAPPDPLTLRRALLIMTQFHWAKSENHGRIQDLLKCYRYDFEKPQDGKLRVNFVADVKPDNLTDGTVLVGLVACPYKRVAMGHLQGLDAAGKTTTYGHMAICSVKVVHVFSDSNVAMLAATSTNTFLVASLQTVLKDIGIMGVEFHGFGEPRLLRKDPQVLYGVDVGLTISFNAAVDVTPESHLLKEVATTLSRQQASQP